MNDISYKVKSRYKLEKIGADGVVKDSSEWSPNMILNRGLVALLGGSGTSNRVFMKPVCGSGNTPVSAFDINLASFISGSPDNAISVSSTRNTSVSPLYVKHTFVWRFPIGSVVGNVSEVGVAITGSTPDSSTPLFSRALVVDSAGNPTSITILSDEQLQITYELYIYAPGDSSGSFDQIIDGVTQPFTYTIRPAVINDTSDSGWADAAVTGIFSLLPVAVPSFNVSMVSNGSIQLPTQGISGTTGRFESAAWIASANESLFYRDARYSLASNAGNFNVTAMQLACSAACFQMSVSPAIQKVSTKSYTIDIRYSVGRIT